MRLLVCGGRTFGVDPPNPTKQQEALARFERIQLYAWLDAWPSHCYHLGSAPHTLIHGAAPGADTLAAQWAQDQRRITVEAYPADWATHGKAAGPIRNQKMLTEGQPLLVVAFINRPLAESRGTADMIGRARAASIRTVVVETA